MKEIQRILKAYSEIDFTKTKAALITVVDVKGSSYRREGARMLIMDDGRWVGGISGGCLEGDALRRAHQAIFKKKASRFTYNTMDDDPFQIGVGLGCRGVIDVFIEPLIHGDSFNPLELLKKVQGINQHAVMLTITASVIGNLLNRRMLYFEDGTHETLIEKQPFIVAFQMLAKKALEDKKSFYQAVQGKEYDGMEVAVELLKPPIELFLFGHHYDVLPLLEFGHTLGWRLNVVANPKNLPKEVFEKAKVIANSPFRSESEALPVQLHEYTAVILMTHDYATDFQVLKRLAEIKVPYLGVLGPKSRTANLLEDLKKEGITLPMEPESAFYAPVGLDIGATSPESIALSIAAEIQAHFGKRSGGFLRNRTQPIYDSKR